MKIVRLALVAMILGSLAGCANPQVVQISPGVYQLGRADHGGIFGNRDALKAGVIRDADAFAEKQGKVAVPVCAREHPVGILGDWASFEYTFRVEDKDAPDAKIARILVVTDSKSSPEFRSLGGKDIFYIAQSVDERPPNTAREPAAAPSVSGISSNSPAGSISTPVSSGGGSAR